MRHEIEALLDRLAGLGCRFQRNGIWHESGEARSHLLRKLQALERRVTLASTEKFIELAATPVWKDGFALPLLLHLPPWAGEGLMQFVCALYSCRTRGYSSAKQRQNRPGRKRRVRLA